MSAPQVRLPTKSSLRRNATWRIALQGARESLFGWGIYVTGAVSVGIAAILIFNALRFVGESSLNILGQPFLLPLQIALSLAMLYIAIEATLSISRPREQGSLQILFFAPIDEAIFIAGNFLAGLLVYILFILLTLPILLLLAWLTNFAVPLDLLWALVPTLFAAGLTISISLFLSAASPSARVAVLILVAGVLMLLGLQSAYTALLDIPPTSRFYDALLFMRTILASLQRLLTWLSPFRMLDVILTSTLNKDWSALFGQLGIALATSILWFAAAVRMLQRKGVLP